MIIHILSEKLEFRWNSFEKFLFERSSSFRDVLRPGGAISKKEIIKNNYFLFWVNAPACLESLGLSGNGIEL